MAENRYCNDCNSRLTAGYDVCYFCGGATRGRLEMHPKLAAMSQKTYETRCLHAGYPEAIVQIVTCDPRTVTICTNCGLEI